jgi:hypothetical protein
MLSSNDIGQALAAQNQNFAGMVHWSQQVGTLSPNTTLAAFGGRPPAMMGAPPGAFTYSPYGYASTTTYGVGSQAAARAISVMGAAGSVGAAFIPGLNPFAAFGAARAAGAGFAGALGATAFPLAGMYAASLPMQWAVGGAQQQAMINQTLGQNFAFYNPYARAGQGFTREGAQAIGEAVRSIAHIPEMLTSVEELTSLLPKLRQAGVMTGVRDVQEFEKRFKESVAVIKDLSRMMGSTMTEAAEMFAHSRSMGFLGGSDILRNQINVQTASAMTGLTQEQVMGAQSKALGFAQAMGGGRRRSYVEGMTRAISEFGSARAAGRITEEQLFNITGKTGPEALEAAAAMNMETALRLTETPIGQLMMYGLAEFDDEDRVVGIDRSKVERLRSGALSVEELKRTGHRNMLHKERKASFVARRRMLAGEVATQVGAPAIADILGQIATGRAGEESSMLIMQQYGIDEHHAELAQLSIGFEEDKAAARELALRRARESMIREQFSAGAIWRRLKTRMGLATGKYAMQEAGAGFFTKLSRSYDEMITDLLGTYVEVLGEEKARVFQRAMAGNDAEIRELFKESSGLFTAADRAMQAERMKPLSTTGGVDGVFVGAGRGMLHLQLFGQPGRPVWGRSRTSLQELFLGRSTEDEYGRLAEALGAVDSADVTARASRLRELPTLPDDQLSLLRALKAQADDYTSLLPSERRDAVRKQLVNVLRAGGVGSPGGHEYWNEGALYRTAMAATRLKTGASDSPERTAAVQQAQQAAAMILDTWKASPGTDITTALLARSGERFDPDSFFVSMAPEMRTRKLREYRSTLEDLVGAPMTEVIQRNEWAREYMGLVQRPEIRAEMDKADPNLTDPSARIRVLERHGLKLSDQERERAIELDRVVGKKLGAREDKWREAMGAVRGTGAVRADAARDIYRDRVRGAAETISAELVNKSQLGADDRRRLLGLKEAASKWDATPEGLYDLRQRVDEIAERARGLKGEERDAFLKSAGRFGEAAASVEGTRNRMRGFLSSGTVRRDGGAVSIHQLATGLRAAPDALLEFLQKDEFLRERVFDDRNRIDLSRYGDEIARRWGAHVGAGKIVGGSDSKSPTDSLPGAIARMNDTLIEVNTTMKNVGTVLTSLPFMGKSRHLFESPPPEQAGARKEEPVVSKE